MSQAQSSAGGGTLSDEVRRKLLAGDYAFLDIGCGSGGSTTQCQSRFGLGRGLGLDWYEADLETARARGLDVASCDVTRVNLPARCVAFASMMDVLEHLADEAAAVDLLERLASVARSFLFIRHPSFDDGEYLAERGLRFSWTDWTAHPNMMRIDDFRRVFAALGWRDHVIVPNMRITDSRHPALVPSSAPTNTVEYDEARHGPKPLIEFEPPIYGKYDIFVRLDPGMAEAEWRRVTTVEGWESIWE